MVRLIGLAIGLILMLTLAAAATRTLGQSIYMPQMRGLDAVLHSSADCEAPCWRGIRPQSTTLDEAEAILSADSAIILDAQRSERHVCWHTRADPAWHGCYSRGVIRLEPPPNAVRLGDVVTLVGQPNYFSWCVERWHSFGVTTYRSRATVFYDNFSLFIGQPITRTRSRFDPNMPIKVLELRPVPWIAGYRWSGFDRRSFQAECGR